MASERYTNHPRQKAVRRRLRRDATPAERRLWLIVRAKRLDGYKFRRQHGIGRFVVDFYCAESKLVVELDGEVHADPVRAEYDAKRQRTLEALGIRVLRFENSAVLDAPDLVAEGICLMLRDEAPSGAQPSPPPDLPRLGEEGSPE